MYNYASINGDYAYTKIRLEGKKMLFGILSNERFAYGLNGKNKKAFNAIYGSIPSIKRAIERKEPVFIPEGEKDVNTLVKKGYAAFSCGGANDWNKNVSELCKGADVIVLADNDDPGKKLASTVVRDLKGTAKSIKVIIPMPEAPKADITDYFEAGHTVEEFENLIRNIDDTEKICADVQQDQKQDTGKKRSVIQKSKDEVAGGPALVFKFLDCNYDEDGNVKSVKQLVHNFEIVMDKDSRFAGKIRLNEFAQQPYLYGNVPWENENNCRAWSSHDDSALFSLIQADYGLKSRQDFADALKNVSMRNKFHPVRELLDSLTWDGKEHIRSLLPECLGAEDSDYTYQVMRLWMLGAVSRVYKPGNKFDYTIILQGSQGIGKSTFLKLMALDDSWFNDSLDSLDSDKAVQSLTGSWIIELAELKSLARTAGGVESVKRFLTATQDKYRIPYERRADTFYRQCVFAGTTNKDDFLQDETGNRRFLIIHTGVIKPSKSLFTPEVMVQKLGEYGVSAEKATQILEQYGAQAGVSSAFIEEMTGKVQALGKGFSESSSTIDTSSITVKESIKGIRSVLYDLSVSSSEYAGTYRGVLEVFNNTSGSAANAQDAFNIVYNALKEAGVPLDELNKKLAQEFPSAAQATKSSVDSSIVEAQKTVSSSTGKMKTDAETNLAGVKKAAEDASGGVNTTTVTNWGNSASEVKKNLDKMKQTANLKLGEMQKTVESHFSGQYNTMTKKWEKACERIGQLITQMVRSTKDSLNGLARNMNTIGNEMSNNLINGISGAVTGIAGILNEVVSKVNSTISNVNSSLSGIEKAFTFSYDVTTPDGKRRWGKYSMNLPRVPTVPYLAKGAVIPPRSEFLAVLGDQKQGNNIETPEALLRKIVREETGGQRTGGGSYRFTAQINRRTLFDEMMKEAQMRRDTSGRNPFEMA